MIIIVALYSILVIPIRIGVNEKLWDPYYNIIDLITWLIYLADVIVNLRTTYIDNFGHEVVETNRIMKKYAYSFRFVLDILSLVNFPTLVIQNLSKGAQTVLNLLGLLKISRYFRAQNLIVQSRLQKATKAQASCGFYFLLLLIYLHVMGCLFFFFCLETYVISDKKVSVIDELGLRIVEADGTESWFMDKFEEEYYRA